MNAGASLDRVFHERSRLAILSALCTADRPLPFTTLRDAAGLTDGNLNRHLKVLAEAGAVAVDKRFVDGKPLTTVALTPAGLRQFGAYLEGLSALLRQARHALPARAGGRRLPALRTAHARA